MVHFTQESLLVVYIYTYMHGPEARHCWERRLLVCCILALPDPWALPGIEHVEHVFILLFADDYQNPSFQLLLMFLDWCCPQHTLIVAEPKNLIDSQVIVGSRDVPPLLYEGTGLIADTENPLVLHLLTADSSAYSHNPAQPIKDVCKFLMDLQQFNSYLHLFLHLSKKCVLS